MSKNINTRLEAFNCQLFLQKSSIKVVRQGSNSDRSCSIKKAVLKNFAKFTENHLRQSLFFNNAAGQ